MRGADGGPWRWLCALPAMWTGLLYDSGALDAAWDLVKDWTAEDHFKLRREVPVRALGAEIGGRKLSEVARETVALANAGLARRKRRNAAGEDETVYLSILEEIAESGRCPAEIKLDKFDNEWAGEIDRVFEEDAY
jgi:glutamate--cysteine ligase